MKKINCLICGGEIELDESGKYGKCRYCDSTFLIEEPLNDETFVKLQLAINEQRNFEYGKAIRTYNDILAKNPRLGEAWWGKFLCDYGIEFERNRSGIMIPTIHRAYSVSVTDNENFQNAVQLAGPEKLEEYANLGERIERIRAKIMREVENGENYDVFICFKATEIDKPERRTVDYELASMIYQQLTAQKYNVFFSPESLIDIPEQDYEPHIYRALSTARVMLLLCSDINEIESPWVMNEWERYFDMHSGNGLVPICGNRIESFSPYHLPNELRKLNAIVFDLGLEDKINRKVESFFPERKEEMKRAEEERRQREIEEIKKLALGAVKSDGDKIVGANIQNLLKRAFIFLEERNWKSADEYCEKVLDIDFQCGMAYLGKFLATRFFSQISDIGTLDRDFRNDVNFVKAVKYMTVDEKKQIEPFEIQAIQNIYKRESAEKEALEKKRIEQANFEIDEKIKSINKLINDKVIDNVRIKNEISNKNKELDDLKTSLYVHEKKLDEITKKRTSIKAMACCSLVTIALAAFESLMIVLCLFGALDEAFENGLDKAVIIGCGVSLFPTYLLTILFTSSVKKAYHSSSIKTCIKVAMGKAVMEDEVSKTIYVNKLLKNQESVKEEVKNYEYYIGENNRAIKDYEAQIERLRAGKKTYVANSEPKYSF